MGFKKTITLNGTEIGDIEQFGDGWHAWSFEIEDYMTTTIQGPLAGWQTMAFPTMQDAVSALVTQHLVPNADQQTREYLRRIGPV